MKMSNCWLLLGAALTWAAGCQSDTSKNTDQVTAPAPTEVPSGAANPDAPAEAAPEASADAAPETPAPQPAPRPTPGAKTPASAEERAPAPMPRPTGGNGRDFLDVTTLDGSIRLDVRYATANNFTKAQIYDCPACLLRPEAARAIAKAHQNLKKQGYGGLKMFDCYRPRPYQQRLWDKVPNPDYVTPPAKGSMHSRGAAVDLTIVDKNGRELDMGTEYDFFGEKAHFDYTKLPDEVLKNRRLLRSTLEAVGFEGIRTEWWHFSFRGKSYPLSDFVWDCK